MFLLSRCKILDDSIIRSLLHILQLSDEAYQNVYYFAVIMCIIIAIFIIAYVMVGEEREEEES